MHRVAVMFCLLYSQWALAWPTVDQWTPIELDGLAVQDVETSGAVADVVGDSSSSLLAWYGETDTLWVRIRVASASLDSDEDSVGVGIRAANGDLYVVAVESGVGRVGEWSSPCEWGATSVTWDSEVYGTQVVDESDGTTTLAIQIPVGDIATRVNGSDSSFQMLAFHAGKDDTDWVLDFGGVDEADTSWQCADDWSDSLTLDTDGDGLLDTAEAWLGSDFLDGDSDDDGLLDGQESLTDVDEDGIVGVLDCDSDGDGLVDGTEAGVTEPSAATDREKVNTEASGPEVHYCFVADADPDTQTDPQLSDTDGGGLSDEQAAILALFSLTTVRDLNGHEYPTLRLTGVNLQIVNGLGATNGNPDDPTSVDPEFTETNGVGNVIVGYNELASGYGTRRGSHNVVVGSQLAYHRFAGLVSGHRSTIEGAYASVSGGRGRAKGTYASVCGGDGDAIGEYATVSGGLSGVASGVGATVSGGDNNEAAGPQAAITGGEGNYAIGYASTITGGNGNVTTSPLSVISAGEALTTLDTHGWAACSLACP